MAPLSLGVVADIVDTIACPYVFQKGSGGLPAGREARARAPTGTGSEHGRIFNAQTSRS